MYIYQILGIPNKLVTFIKIVFTIKARTATIIGKRNT